MTLMKMAEEVAAVYCSSAFLQAPFWIRFTHIFQKFLFFHVPVRSAIFPESDG